MDSLLASYASSDEEEREEQPSPQRIPPAKRAKSQSEAGEENEDFLPKSTSIRGGIFNSLPPPKSSLFNSLPPPKSQSSSDPKPQSEIHSKKTVDVRDELIAGNSKPKSSSASLFSSIPQPKASSTSAAPKRVVQFRPPTIANPHVGSLDDEDEDSDEGEDERKRKRSKESINTSSPASFLSSIPAPRNSAAFGALPTASGMSRRSVLETGAPSSNVSTVTAPERDAIVNPNVGYSNDQSNDTNYAYSSWGSESESHAYYSGNAVDPNGNVGTAPSSSVSTGSDSGLSSDLRHLGGQSNEIYDHPSLGGENYAYYGSGSASADATGVSTDYEAVDYSYAQGQPVEYPNYGGDYADIAQYENHSANSAALPEVSRAAVENSLQALGRRGRKDVPQEIVEVKQDELMKNRPRQDQVKSTGIAFGPAYQPATTKGKPPKLHKRKHQIGSLYFDMKSKEMELAERRSKGFLTKAQTQAKYGW